MDTYFARRLCRPDRWRRFHEVFNVIDINRVPPDYAGSQEEWIQDITTFQQLYPEDWERLKKEYDLLVDRHFSGLNQCKELEFTRTEEGSLRMTSTKEHLLRIRLKTDCRKVDALSFARRVKVETLMDFSMYVAYTRQRKKVRKRILSCLKKELVKRQEEAGQGGIPLEVSFEEGVDTSLFQGTDIFVDVLNHEYFIL